MKTTIKPDASVDMVKKLREIRDEISDEIKNMSFEEESAYLDKLLASGKKANLGSGKNFAEKQ